MIPRLLTSLQHPLVKKLVKLRESRDFRREEGTVLLVGETVIQEIAPHCQIKTLISTKPLPLKAATSELASPEVLQKIIGHKTDDLVAAEIVAPSFNDLKNCRLIVLLDGLSDPGNVGTIFRTAIALGWEGILVIEGSADPYNDKALRASRGAPLLLPWKEISWQDAEAFVKESHPQILFADIKGTPLSKMKFSAPLLLILGHETRGPSPDARSLGEPITIPMKGAMESLNVASAASILLYHIAEELS
ncbi:MAG: RNA methyltransferase [Rhabdochlamydiaceae bacterium]|nr:RNA methyltransferase [Rhabdochlamydiaceae bacterium]